MTYVALPPPTYSGTVDTPVIVQALLQTGYAWSQMPAGWIETSGSVAEYHVLLKAGSCQVATPVAPSVTEAVCRGGVLLPPILKMSETQGITYTASPSSPPAYVAGQSVTVTATLSAGRTWPATLPTGWTRQTATTATYQVTFANTACTPVLPLQPVVTQATCANGAVTTPTVVLVVTPGVTYELSPSGAYNGAVTTVVTVTATVVDGFAWGQVSLPWTKVSDLRATMTVTLNAASCAQVVPVAPTVVEARCRAGVVEPPSLTVGPTDRITYTLSDPVVRMQQGGSVTVTATLAPAGVGWPANLGDWTRVSATVATLTVTFKPMACIPVSPVAPEVTPATCRRWGGDSRRR